MQAPGSEVGRWFGPYELRSLLGTGGMGEVYEAYDTVKERVVALKLLSDALAGDPEYQIRFRRESQAAARLAEPHIIPIHDWGVIEGRLFIDMRLVQGTDLRALLQADGPLSPQRAVAVIEQIAAALDAAHEAGLVHRDVKPANILVTPADFAYLADFGIARHESDTGVTRAGVAIGSYTYMAPERFDSGPVTPRADIYSLACVLHECLTGATPFPATSVGMLIRSHLTEPPPRASVQRTGLPAALDDVIAWGMAKDPHERFATAGELAVAARTALNSPARPPYPAGPQPRSGESPAIAEVPAPSAPPTGGIPTLVVRIPREEDTPDPATTLPAIIPGDPTSFRPTETEFTPLPADDPAPAADPEAPPGGIRPFPDAHLYQNEQLHPAVDPSQYENPAPATGGMPVADFYPHDQATRIYGEPGYPVPVAEESTRVFRDETPAGQAYPAQDATRAYRPVERDASGLAYPADDPARAYLQENAGFAYSGEDTTRAYQPVDDGHAGLAYSAEDATRAYQPVEEGHVGLAYSGEDATRAYQPVEEGHAGLAYSGEDATRAYQPLEEGHAGLAYSAEETTRAYQPMDRTPPELAYSAEEASPAPRPQYPASEPTGRYDAAAPGEHYGYRAQDPGPPADPYAAAYEAGYRDSYAANARARDTAPGGERSKVVPIATGIGVFAVVIILAVLGIQFLGGSEGPESTGAADTIGAATTSAPERTSAADSTGEPSAATSARTSTTTSATTTTARADLPAGAQPCSGVSSGGSEYGSAATGTAVTSCEFAEAVRQAYLDPSVVSAEGDPVSVEATSPVTGQAYTLECVAAAGLVTCRGGNNAIVYLY
ncbi:serine/threonine-protein kinase [Nocardia testacea]|uniref:serine/threonine-protein kinase n=1 Tax=Nocardia testacea TaxID=248551 RepID=UPI003F4D5AA4